MRKFYKYPSIEQFRNILKGLKEFIQFDNVIVTDEGIKVATYDFMRPLPEVDVMITEKLHGTNAGVVFTKNDIYPQSRNNVISIEKDNQGFAMFVERNKEALESINHRLRVHHNISENDTVIIFGEFCGGNIQSKSAVSGLDKMFVLFKDFKVSKTEDSEELGMWLDTNLEHSPENNIYNICNFPTEVLKLDFNSEESIAKFLETIQYKIDKIEESSLVGEALGKSGNIGEGFVCDFKARRLTGETRRFVFKCKGEKHSSSKVTKSQQPKTKEELEQLSELEKFTESICHDWRFEQGVVETCGSLDNSDIKKIGEYLKFVSQDTIKEESDLIIESGFEMKQIMSGVSKRAKSYFMSILKV